MIPCHPFRDLHKLIGPVVFEHYTVLKTSWEPLVLCQQFVHFVLVPGKDDDYVFAASLGVQQHIDGVLRVVVTAALRDESVRLYNGV